MEKTFKEDLLTLLNTHSAENRSNTPDYILANYILTCLNAFDDAVNERTKWYEQSNSQSGLINQQSEKELRDEILK